MMERPAVTPVLIALLSALCAGGCAMSDPGAGGTIHSVSNATQHQRVSLTYRTDSDRLNQGTLATQPVAYHRGGTAGLPNVTVSTLEIIHPHPYDVAGHALAKVTFRPAGEQTALASSWRQFVGSLDDELNPSDASRQMFETLALDVPLWQLESILTKLKQMNYFRRSRSLNAAAFLAMQIDGVGFGKNYQAIPELDAMILRVHALGQPLHQSPPTAVAPVPAGTGDHGTWPLPTAQRSTVHPYPSSWPAVSPSPTVRRLPSI